MQLTDGPCPSLLWGLSFHFSSHQRSRQGWGEGAFCLELNVSHSMAKGRCASSHWTTMTGMHYYARTHLLAQMHLHKICRSICVQTPTQQKKHAHATLIVHITVNPYRCCEEYMWGNLGEQTPSHRCLKMRYLNPAVAHTHLIQMEISHPGVHGKQSGQKVLEDHKSADFSRIIFFPDKDMDELRRCVLFIPLGERG